MNKFYSYDEPENEELGIRPKYGPGAVVGALAMVTAILAALLLMLFAAKQAHAAVKKTTEGKWFLVVSSSPVYPAVDTLEVCESNKAARINADAKTKTSGKTTYYCRRGTEVEFGPNPIVCPALPAQRTQACPTGTVGSWTQTPAMSPAPACLVTWTPATAPDGACTVPPPTETYTACGDERGTCAGTGFKRICYSSSVALCTDAIASNDRKLETTLPIACNNDRFSGDPVPGVVKRCFVSDVVLTPPAPEPGSGVASLSWTTPTLNTDGTPVDTLAGYTIVYGTASDQLTRLIQINSASITSYVVGDLAKGTYYFAVRARTTRGAESANSNIAVKEIT